MTTIAHTVERRAKAVGGDGAIDDDDLLTPPRASPFASTWVVLAVVAGLAATLGLAVALSFRWVSQREGWTIDELNKVAGLWAGFITATLTASVALLSAMFQSRAAARLEGMKTTLARRLEHTKAELAGQLEDIRAVHAEELEAVRSKLARALEFTKGRYAAERRAYDELLGAVYTYYYTLSPLERGVWDPVQVAKAEDGMVAACRHLVAVDPTHRRTWLAFWQSARNVRELASRIEAGSDVDRLRQKRQELWISHARTLGAAIHTLEAAAAERHRWADDSTLDRAAAPSGGGAEAGQG